MAICSRAVTVFGLAFSRDRPIQLDGTLRSLRRHCQYAKQRRLTIVYRATSRRQRSAYRALRRDHATPGHSGTFLEESDFQRDVQAVLVDADAADGIVSFLSTMRSSFGPSSSVSPRTCFRVTRACSRCRCVSVSTRPSRTRRVVWSCCRRLSLSVESETIGCFALVGSTLKATTATRSTSPAPSTAVRTSSRAVLVAQESFRRRARGESDPAQAATLDDAMTFAALDNREIEAAFERACIGRASLLGRAGGPWGGAGLWHMSGRASPLSLPVPSRARRAARHGRTRRLVDDFRGARLVEPRFSWLTLELGARWGLLRARTALERGFDRLRAGGAAKQPVGKDD